MNGLRDTSECLPLCVATLVSLLIHSGLPDNGGVEGKQEGILIHPLTPSLFRPVEGKGNFEMSQPGTHDTDKC